MHVESICSITEQQQVSPPHHKTWFCLVNTDGALANLLKILVQAWGIVRVTFGPVLISASLQYVCFSLLVVSSVESF